MEREQRLLWEGEQFLVYGVAVVCFLKPDLCILRPGPWNLYPPFP